MASERITEELVLNEMDFEIGKNKFGNAFAQSDAVQFSENLKKALERAGGKPKVCEIDNYELGGYGIGKPEFIITFDKDKDTVLVVECKASIKKLPRRPSGFHFRWSPARYRRPSGIGLSPRNTRNGRNRSAMVTAAAIATVPIS